MKPIHIITSALIAFAVQTNAQTSVKELSEMTQLLEAHMAMLKKNEKPMPPIHLVPVESFYKTRILKSHIMGPYNKPLQLIILDPTSKENTFMVEDTLLTRDEIDMRNLINMFQIDSYYKDSIMKARVRKPLR